MPSKLPLKPNFFQCPKLTDEEFEMLKRHGNQSAMDIVHKTHLNGDLKWTLRSDEVDLRIYKCDDPSAKTGTYLYMSVMEVAGTLDEVVDLFQTRTTEQAKAYIARFGKQLLDAIKLYSLVEPTAEYPMEMMSVTWRAYKSPLSMFVSKRDACLLECNHSFTLDGRRGWVTSSKSIKLNCCPELQDLCGLIRLMNYGSGHVFLESDTRPGYLEMRYIAQIDFRGVSYDFVSDSILKRRAWISDMNMTKRCRNLQDIDQFLREDRLSRGTILRPNQLVNKSTRSFCFLCTTRFGLTTPKANCLKCGQVVCSSCIRVWSIKLHEAQRVSIKACVKCAMGPAGSSRSIVQTPSKSIVSFDSDGIWDFDTSQHSYVSS